MTVTEPSRGLEAVVELRRQLVELIRRQASVIRAIGTQAQQERWLYKLDDLAHLVENNTFKVLVVGQFSRGKSTLINALLGRKVLPSHATETTAIINAVKFAEKPRALVYPRAAEGEPPPAPIEVGIELNDLEPYLTVRDDIDTSAQYVMAEVFWPLDLCRNGVELIDSPGIDALDEHREQATIDQLSRVDAVIMVLDGQSAITRRELNFYLEVVRPLGHDDALWVANKINLVEEEEREGVQRALQRDLAALVRPNRIFFVDARGGLQAKSRGDAAGLVESGIPLLERNLEVFLTQQRGRAKIYVPVRNLQKSVRELREEIHVAERLLEEDLDTLRERAHQAELPLRAAEKTARHLSDKLDRELSQVADQVRNEAVGYLQQLIMGIPELVENTKVNTKISLSPGRVRTTVAARSEELVDAVRTTVEADIARWRTEKLNKGVLTRLRKVQKEIAREVKELEVSLQGVKLGQAAVSHGHVKAIGDLSEIAKLGVEGSAGALAEFGAQKILGGAAAGAATFAVGSAAAGFLGLTLLTPVILPAMVLVIIVRLATANPREVLETRITREVTKGIVNQLNEVSPQLVEMMSTEAAQYLEQVGTEFRSGLTTQVATLRQELEDAVSAKTRGADEVTHRTAVIRAQLEELRTIESELDEILDVVLMLDADPDGEPDPTGHRGD